MKADVMSEERNVLLLLPIVPSPLRWGMVKIGELAFESGESVKTLRYWTDLGLLAAERGTNGYRYYGAGAAERAQFIRGAQALGLTLREIRDVLDARGHEHPPCQEARAVLARHLRDARERLAQWTRLEAELSERLAWAEAHPRPVCNGEGCVYLADTPAARPGAAA
ncbi:MAG TPA: MerR family transcriptional regulator [Trueperaceae bacterium]